MPTIVRSCSSAQLRPIFNCRRATVLRSTPVKFRQRFETEMIEKNDTHFFVGTVHKNPASFIVVGLFYPPKLAMNDLFA